MRIVHLSDNLRNRRHRHLSDKYKCNSPVTTNLHGPGTLTIPFKLMKTQSRQVHIFWGYGHIESTEKTQPFSVLGLDPSLASCRKKLLQSLVLEAADH